MTKTISEEILKEIESKIKTNIKYLKIFFLYFMTPLLLTSSIFLFIIDSTFSSYMLASVLLITGISTSIIYRVYQKKYEKIINTIDEIRNRKNNKNNKHE